MCFVLTPHFSQGLHAYSVDPGIVDTQLARRAVAVLPPALSPEEGAETVVFVATEDDVRLKNGSYYCKKIDESSSDRLRKVRSDEDALRLWEYSECAVENHLTKQ